jgi:hypothetical protein
MSVKSAAWVVVDPEAAIRDSSFPAVPTTGAQMTDVFASDADRLNEQQICA